MHSGDRIKILRMGDGLTQEYIGELLGKSQKTITKIESGKSHPGQEELYTLSHYFIVSRRWLEAGIPPMIEDGWGYASVPFKNWEDLPKSARVQRLNQIATTMQTLFPEFLKESKIKRYYRADIEDSLEAFFVFPLSSKSSLVMRVMHLLWSVMEDALKSAGVRLAKAIDVERDLAEFVHQSSSPASRLKSVIKLHRLLGIEKSTKTWKELNITRQPRCLEAYQNRTLKICRDILAKEIDPLDVIKTLKKLTEARINYTFEDSVDYLLSRKKAPLLKSHSEKVKDESSSDC